MSLFLLILACAPKTTPEPVVEPEPAPQPAPARTVAVAGPLSSDPVDGMPGVTGHVTSVAIDGVDHPVRWMPVAASGQEMGGVIYGQQLDAKGQPMPWPTWLEDPPEGPAVCNILDFAALVHTEWGWFHTAHMECGVGGMYATPIAFDDDGSIETGTPRNVDFSGVGGATTLCSGDITPWNTHLASEEYEANARWAGPDGTLVPEQMSMDSKHPFEWSFLNNLLTYTDSVHPYRMGWIPEIAITSAQGDTQVAKHYSMGRFSHELGLVMPDRRTVYLSDDQYHAGFFVFVADEADDLSAGTLYASKWTQTSDTSAGVEWVSLGHAADVTIGQALARPVNFDDVFEVADLSQEGTCPEGFGRTTHTWGTECLKTKDPVLASRLETRRYAGLLGATTEFSKGEGIAFDPGTGPEDSAVYLATSKISVGMLEESEPRGPGDYRRAPEADHLKLPENRCGIVWRLAMGEGVDTDGEPIYSGYIARQATAAVVGVPEGEKGCSEAAISNPDNITFVDDFGWLVVAEDTKGHEHDVLWAIDVRDPQAKPMRLAEVEKDSEVTGIHWFDVEGKGYLTVTNQWDPSTYRERKSVTALLGPFPISEP